jgi:hypothetical protein
LDERPAKGAPVAGTSQHLGLFQCRLRWHENICLQVSNTRKNLLTALLFRTDSRTDFQLSRFRGRRMPGGSDWLDTLLLAGLAILFAGFAFLSAVEGWRRWSDNRRIRKHFRK